MCKLVYYIDKRLWLNPTKHSDTGAIQYHVSKYEGDSWVDASFTIWDCSRKTTLSFDFNGEQAAKQRAEKVDALIDALQQFKQAMGEAYNDMPEELDNESLD